MNIHPEYTGSLVDVCEDCLTEAVKTGVIQGPPEVIFENTTYDVLAEGVNRVLDLHQLEAGKRAESSIDAYDALHATAAGYDITLLALEAIRNAYGAVPADDAFNALATAVANPVTAAIVNWLKTKPDAE